MSEFKFACPVCGQHITADSSASGSQLDCPTCFRQIVIPQATSSDSKLVLSASEAGKRRRTGPIPTPPVESVRAPVRKINAVPMILGAIFGLVGVAAVAFVLLWPKSGSEQSQTQTNAASARQIPAGTVQWTLDLGEAEIPAETAFGKIHGSDFVCDRAVLQGGMLSLRMGKDWPPELGLSIFLYARQAEELSGKSAVVNTNNIRSPRVLLRWREDGVNKTESFTNGYAMRLEFGAIKGNRLPGKIYLCVPDDVHSCVGGVFNAEVRRPSPPRPRNGPNSSN